jgi:hypothetical protein
LTSGSTGQPKLVVGEKQRAEALALVLHRYQDSAPAERSIVVLPLTYCYAFVNQWLWSRVVGRALCITNGFSQPDALQRELTPGGDTLHGQRTGAAARRLAGVRFRVFKSTFAGAFSAGQKGFLGNTFRAEVYNNYGCAEAMPRLLRRAGASRQEAILAAPCLV